MDNESIYKAIQTGNNQLEALSTIINVLNEIMELREQNAALIYENDQLKAELGKLNPRRTGLFRLRKNGDEDNI